MTPRWSAGRLYSRGVVAACILGSAMVLACGGDRLVDPDGKRVSVEEAWPAWAPDGNRVAYWSAYSDRGPAGVYILDFRDSTRRWVSPGITPAWSPDGDRIVVGLPEGLGVISIDHPDSAVIIYGGEAFLPAWSPSGQWIAFDKVVQSVKGIWITRADGSGQTRRVTHAGVYARAPSWSPDGERLLCAARASGQRKDVCVVSVDSGAIQQLTDTPAVDEHFPRWNAAGTDIVYLGVDGLYLLAEGRRYPARIIGTTPDVRLIGSQSASWSPNGSQLVYNKVRLWMMNADGTANHELAH